MQDYPVRERIYLPVVRFGVPHTDWKYVFLITFAAFVLPFVFDIRLYGIPVPMFTGTLALAASVAFFNFIRLGRRPYWFQHQFRQFFTSSRRRATLPQDDLDEPWLKLDTHRVGGRETEGDARSNASQVFQFEH